MLTGIALLLLRYYCVIIVLLLRHYLAATVLLLHYKLELLETTMSVSLTSCYLVAPPFMPSVLSLCRIPLHYTLWGTSAVLLTPPKVQ